MQRILEQMGRDLLPVRCLLCGAITQEMAEICPACLSRLRPFPKPVCDICGASLGRQTQCISCMRRLPPFDFMRGVFVYETSFQQMIHRYKYGRSTYFKNFLGKTMTSYLLEHPILFDLVTCVPMHWTKVMHRGYNQSALLAGMVAKNTGLEFKPSVLKKIRATKAQAGLDKKNRKRNMRGAFTASKVNGRAVLVIDDVITTGQTAIAVSSALRQAGASYIGFLSAGRVL